LSTLIEWADSLGEFWFYLALGFCSLLENLFTPFPGDTCTVFGAYLAGLGKVNAWGVFLASTAGGTIGFTGLYLIGRFAVKKMEGKGKFLGLSTASYNKISCSFQRWGYGIVIFNRLFYGVRFAIAIFAGFTRLNLGKTIAAALLGTALWNILLVYLGMELGENWQTFKSILWKYNRVILSAAAIALGIYLLWRFIWRRKKYRIPNME